MIRTIGLMSGTSLDGVDAAWLETDGVRIGTYGPTVTLPYTPALKARLRRLLDQADHLDDASIELREVEEALTRRHAEAVAALGRSADLIGFHGQTILHRPDRRRTWQIGDARLLAQLTGMPIAYDFRSSDVAAGGQGAPLAPVFHAALAQRIPGEISEIIAVLNIGGVANVTWISGDHLVAFDTGPGNGPLDDWARRWGYECDRAVLQHLLANPYFARPAPKSLDRLEFATSLAESGLEQLSAADGAATLVSFTVEAVAAAMLPATPRRWLVCGGGRHNPSIMRALHRRMGVSVEPVEAVGWNGDALEAQCFGFLAARVNAGLPLSFPTTTGVKNAIVAGKIVLPSTT
jgi:anhydro-N-acetylmuramic acid kinase